LKLENQILIKMIKTWHRQQIKRKKEILQNNSLKMILQDLLKDSLFDKLISYRILEPRFKKHYIILISRQLKIISGIYNQYK
jgi:hypothetical protein